MDGGRGVDIYGNAGLPITAILNGGYVRHISRATSAALLPRFQA